MSFNWKSLTEKQLAHIFEDTFFKISPRWHQLVSLAFAAEHSRVVFEHGVGSGKTLCALFTAQLRKCKKILVVCPGTAFGAWDRDIPKGTDYSYAFLVGSRKERLATLKEKHDIYVINFEGLKSIYCKLVRVGAKRRKWKITSAFLDEFDGIVIDEIHRCNDCESLQTKICYGLSKRAKCVIGMTGTSIDKSMLELFSIYRVVDLGDSLGLNFYLYRNAYFDKKTFELRSGRTIPYWELKEGAKINILKRISGNTISFDRDECVDLPELQEIEIPVKSSKEFLNLQDQIIKKSFINIEDIEISNTGAKASRLRELSGGFFYYGDGNQRKSYCLKKNSKLETLLDLIVDSDSKIIVFYWYVEEKKLIERMLKKNKIGFISICGGQDDEERREVEKKFASDSNVRVMTAQSRISEGYDASVANIGVFYLPLGSPRMRTQCIGRFYRSGQTRKSLAIDLVLENSVDKRIIEDRGERFSLVNSVKRYMQGYRQEENDCEL